MNITQYENELSKVPESIDIIDYKFNRLTRKFVPKKINQCKVKLFRYSEHYLNDTTESDDEEDDDTECFY